MKSGTPVTHKPDGHCLKKSPQCFSFKFQTLGLLLQIFCDSHSFWTQCALSPSTDSHVSAGQADPLCCYVHCPQTSTHINWNYTIYGICHISLALLASYISPNIKNLSTPLILQLSPCAIHKESDHICLNNWLRGDRLGCDSDL